jgi:lysozyme family protein
MSKSTYDAALTRLFQHEGRYTNHPSDPGGPTNFGITIFDYRKYVKPGATAADIKAMRVEEAKSIYRAKYWDSQLCDDLEPGVDYCIFDYGVNSGIGRSGRVLRRILGLPDNTSQITPAVVAAANARKAADLVDDLCSERLRFLHALKTWPVFGKGWGRRVAEVRAFAESIASDIPMIGGPSIVPAPGRAINPDKFARVRALQASLIGPPGFYDGAVDGDLGPKTVKAFQRSAHLDDDGVVGKKTRPLLDAALAAIKPLTENAA